MRGGPTAVLRRTHRCVAYIASKHLINGQVLLFVDAECICSGDHLGTYRPPKFHSRRRPPSLKTRTYVLMCFKPFVVLSKFSPHIRGSQCMDSIVATFESGFVVASGHVVVEANFCYQSVQINRVGSTTASCNHCNASLERYSPHGRGRSCHKR